MVKLISVIQNYVHDQSTLIGERRSNFVTGKIRFKKCAVKLFKDCVNTKEPLLMNSCVIIDAKQTFTNVKSTRMSFKNISNSL